jgi:hypothetical protein
MKYVLTAKAEVDRVGAKGTPIPADHPDILYYLCHEYVEPASLHASLEAAPTDGAVRSGRRK